MMMHRFARPILASVLILGATSAPSGALAWSGVNAGESEGSVGDGSASGCTELPETSFPVRYDVSFEGDIRPFVQSFCGSCHGSSGSMSLAAGAVRSNLLVDQTTGLETGRLAFSQPSPPGGPYVRVSPGNPLDSMLFLRLNCDQPPVGSRMPLGGTAPPEMQALVHDWIAAGALMASEPDADRLFLSGLESIVRPTPAP